MSRLSMNVSSSLSPYPHLEPISDDRAPTQSASLAQAERQIKALKDENLTLKTEMAEIGSAYKQLITENNHESYDERRVNFLKAQLIQLERQVIILTEALSSRSSTLLDVENSLAAIVELSRHYLGKSGKIGEISMTKDDLNRMVQTAESARIRLYKNVEDTSSDRVKKPIIMLDKFLHTSPQHPVTLLDVCSGSLEHINLKHVAKLESRLSQLYRQLMLLNQSLNSIVRANGQQTNQEKALFESANKEKTFHTKHNSHLVNAELPKCLYARLGVQSSRASAMLKDATDDLLMLSILVPSAPWPVLKKPLLKELTTENVMSKVTGTTRSKMTEFRGIIDSLLKVMNYTCLMSGAEARVLKEEVTFHQKIYQLQLEYTESLWQALRMGYNEFQTNTDNLICQPMTEILEAYDTLQLTASEDALKYFLKVFKQNHQQITTAVKKLSSHLEDHQGEEAISAYGEDFFNAMNQLRVEQQENRDAGLSELDVAKQQFDNYNEEIRKMFSTDSTIETSPNRSCETEVSLLSSQLGKVHIDNKHKQTEVSKRNVRLKKKEQKLEWCSSTEVLTGNTMEGTADAPDCNCDVGNSERHQAVDTPDTPQVESLYTKAADKPKNKQNSTRDENCHMEDRATDPALRKPPKPVKGVAQSKLTLKSSSKSRKNHQKIPEPEPIQEVFQPLSARSGSLSELSPRALDDSHEDIVSTQCPRVRSGSLSRVGQRATKPSHLEPLVSQMTYSRFSGGKSSGPWK